MNSNLKLFELSGDFQFALDQLEHSNGHFFITGKAGTGKSTLLTLFRNTTRKKVAVLAPTGIAALQIKGQTIHSFFGFPPQLITSEHIFRRRNYKLYQNIDMIIIDEISMVRADMLDAIDQFLKVNRGNAMNYGGVQMVFFGDLYQLPPIISTREEYQYLSARYETPYFFSANVAVKSPFQTIVLQKIYRQEERQFIKLLDNIRTMNLDYDDLEDLNARVNKEYSYAEPHITITPRNSVAESINQTELHKIEELQFSYTAEISGEFKSRIYPAPALLHLKKGAQVMFVKNDPEKNFVNGTLGKVMELDSQRVQVFVEKAEGGHHLVDVPKLDWEYIRYIYDEKEKTLETKTLGTFNQFPLKLAWGITIHKSQGQSFDHVIIDMGKGAFEFGQTYVALSRCRTLDGITLKRPLQFTDIKIDPRIAEFYGQV